MILATHEMRQRAYGTGVLVVAERILRHSERENNHCCYNRPLSHVSLQLEPVAACQIVSRRKKEPQDRYETSERTGRMTTHQSTQSSCQPVENRLPFRVIIENEPSGKWAQCFEWVSVKEIAATLILFLLESFLIKTPQ